MKTTWKRTVVALTALGAVAGATVQANAATCGDVNGNGSLTSADCVQMLDVIAGPPDPSPLCGGSGIGQCGDLNADGAVNISDAIICLSAAAGNDTLFALCSGPGTNVCPGGGNVNIASNVTSNQRWGAGCTYTLDGTIFVNANVTLTIDPGVTVRGKKVTSSGDPATLIFRRDSKINANGTAAAPIVFTSDQPAGSRTKGDWGGVVLNGRAPTNVPGGEGLAEGLTNVPFGGSELNDSSGVARFIRIEYAGRALTVDNELNLWTMNGVGAGTQMDHIQAHYGLDDCLEWFGGTVNSKFMVASACGDDGFDWQLGTTGKLQFGLVAQNECAVEGGSHGFEGDNNENDFNLAPRSAPTFCNVTAIGTRGQNLSLNSIACNDPASEFGMHVRRGTAGRFANLIVEKFGGRGMRLEHGATASQACAAGPTLTGNLLVNNSIFFDNGATGGNHAEGSVAGGTCDSDSFYGLVVASQGVQPADGSVGTDPLVSTAWPPADPRPAIGSIAQSGGFNCSALDAFFDATAYIGAFEPGGTNWLTAPWIDFTIDGLS